MLVQVGDYVLGELESICSKARSDRPNSDQSPPGEHPSHGQPLNWQKQGLAPIAAKMGRVLFIKFCNHPLRGD
ncbi:MAG: hypothetical protein EA366_10915 [Spirulina sp. DLM2.Bin59]|nr:MAG: hypothetical protein EA366_10915 [Spirulina sp. DLM2.Bin59]